MDFPIHGLLLIDKPSGPTSHDVVAKVRKVFATKAVGHTGTLDPLASGLMVLLLGEATKISDYLRDGVKGYEVEGQLGLRTDTLDTQGETLEQRETYLSASEVEAAVLRNQGKMQLDVPRFSAIKVGGKKLYQYAREGKDMPPPKRPMNFWDMEFLSLSEQRFCARMSCSKGSYIRSWVAKVGEDLGVPAVVSALRRWRSSDYEISRALSWERLLQLEGVGREEQVGALGRALVPLPQALPRWKALTVGGRDERLMRNGQIPRSLSQRLLVEQKRANCGQAAVGVKVMSASQGQLLSLLEAQPFSGLKIRRIFNFQ